MSIAVLDENTINQIAAGEVIERPASIVKELLENAIDARATAITVEVRDGGTSLIRITDNGCGIEKEEVPMAFLRHATSKIRDARDLTSILSLGFRGEALASVAAVARVEMITKTSDSLTGTRYRIEGGKELGLEEVGVPEGTTFLVRDLFYNTPARKKFLKQPATEGSYVQDFVEKIALSRPDISIRYIKGSANVLHTSGNHNLKDIIYEIYGRELTANLIPVEGKEGPVEVSGYICKPIVARSNRNCETYFINGRYIKNPLISKAIEEAYRPFLMKHKFPFTVLHFTIGTESLDVNVHPAKMEVRFENGESIYRAVYRAVSAALCEKELIPEVSLTEEKEQSRDHAQIHGSRSDTPEPFEKRRLEAGRKTGLGSRPAGEKPSEGAAENAGSLDLFQSAVLGAAGRELKWREAQTRREPELHRGAGFLMEEGAAYGNHPAKTVLPETMTAVQPSNASPAASSAPTSPALSERKGISQPEPLQKPEQMELFDGKLLEASARSRHKLIGQLFDTYWMVEYRDQLFIIDQHAAHEKVLYEKNMRALRERKQDTQLLSPPIILTLTVQEAAVLEQHRDYFAGMGFEIEHFGGREYAVRGVPANLLSIAKKDLLLEILDGLSEDISHCDSEMIYARVATMSCKAAVKGGHALSVREADELIDQLLELENPYACPHGRPTIISMSRYELEKKFKRIV